MKLSTERPVAYIVQLMLLSMSFSLTLAQADTARNPYLDMSLEELLNMEVVSASKMVEKSSDAPATFYLITEDQIRIRGYTNLEEVLEDIPEIEIQKKSSVEYSNYYTLRGIDGSEKFIIMMDGMRINSSTGTPLAIANNYPVTNAKQIEIILGPASALYGVDAFTGIINIITRNGSEAKGINISGSYGMYNTTSNSIMAGVGNQDISFVVTGNYYFSDEPNFPKEYKDEYRWFNERYSENGEMLVSPWDNTVVNLPVEKYETPTNSYAVHAKLNIKDFEVGYFRNYESHSSSFATKPEFSVYSKEASYKFLVESFYSSYNYDSENKKWNIRTTLSHSRDEVDPNSLYINTYTSYVKGYKYAFNRSLKLEEQVTYRFSDASSLITGISYEDITALPKTGDLPIPFNRGLAADFQDIYYIGTNIIDRDSNDLTIPQDFYYLQYQNIGSFLQFRSKLTPTLNLTIGGRIDYNTRYETTINPRAGLIYSPSDKLKFKVLYGKAYLSPSPYRTYQHYGSFIPATDSTGEITGLRADFWRLPGGDLESQKISTYETSISYFISSNLIISANGFYNDIDDILSSEGYPGQLFHGVPVGIVERPVNKGTANSYGGSVRLNYKKNWQAVVLNSYLAYTFIDGEIDGKYLPLAAKNTIKGGTDLNIKDFSLSPRFIYRSESYHRSLKDAEGNPVTNDAFILFNLAARYQFIDNESYSIDLFLKISNLLNSKYYNVPLGGAESIPKAPQDPIKIMFGVNLSIL